MKRKTYLIFTSLNVVVLIVVVVLFSSFKVQSNEPIMYLDLKAVIQQVPQYEKLQQEYKQDYINIIKELKSKQLSTEASNSQQNFEKLQQEAANTLHVKYIKKFQKLEESIKKYVAQYAKERGITIVLNSDSIIYGDSLCNITQDVVRYIINTPSLPSQ